VLKVFVARVCLTCLRSDADVRDLRLCGSVRDSVSPSCMLRRPVSEPPSLLLSLVNLGQHLKLYPDPEAHINHHLRARTPRLHPSPHNEIPCPCISHNRVTISKPSPILITLFKMLARRPLLPSSVQTLFNTQLRCLHANAAPVRIPRPTPFVPNPETFLTLIGRNMSQHSAKFPSWEALFSLTSEQLRESGIEPARNRRYLLHWREKFRNGEFGIGGDLTDVQDGAGEIKIIEVPTTTSSSASSTARATLTSSPGMRKVVVNVPAGQLMPSKPLEQVKPVSNVKIVRSGIIAGSHVEHIKGRPGVARIVAKEGLWEQTRGHKVDGGERRKAEVRSKRRAEERKTSRA